VYLHGAKNELRPKQNKNLIQVEYYWKLGWRKTCAMRLLIQTMCQLAVMVSMGASLCSAQSFRGADIPWITYEAEDMTNTGTALGRI